MFIYLVYVCMCVYMCIHTCLYVCVHTSYSTMPAVTGYLSILLISFSSFSVMLFYLKL